MSKENNNNEFVCGCPKDYYQQKLTKCQDWETNKKKKLEEIIAGDKCAGMCGGTKPNQCRDRVCTKMGGDIWSPCSQCQQPVINEYRDKKPHSCKNNDNNIERERERESKLKPISLSTTLNLFV